MPEFYGFVGKNSFGSKIAIMPYGSNEYHIFIAASPINVEQPTIQAQSSHY